LLILEGNATHSQPKWFGRKCNRNHAYSFKTIGARENIKKSTILRAQGYAQFRICSTHSKMNKDNKHQGFLQKKLCKWCYEHDLESIKHGKTIVLECCAN